MKEEKLEDEIRTVPLEVLREFLVEDVEYVRPSRDWIHSENSSGRKALIEDAKRVTMECGVGYLELRSLNKNESGLAAA